MEEGVNMFTRIDINFERPSFDQRITKIIIA